MISGFKNITVFDSIKEKKSVSLNIAKSTGIVLSEKSIISQNILSGSIILDILNKENLKNAEI